MSEDKPARGYSWPSAKPGDRLALKHGAYSEMAVAERAGLVHQHLLEVAPWCDEPQFMPSVQRYTEATAREQLAHEALVNGTGKFNARLLEAATSAARLAWAMGDALGLTPAGHAKLKLLTAGAVDAEASMADRLAAGRQARLDAEARMARDRSDSPVEALDATAADIVQDGGAA
jgi:hypothetical protein